MVYYFAGLLTGLRKARWFASRGFGLGLAVVANFSLFAVPEFWHALLIIVVAGTLLALAVWGGRTPGGARYTARHAWAPEHATFRERDLADVDEALRALAFGDPLPGAWHAVASVPS